MAKKLASDRLLFGSVVLLVGTGLLMIYSASAIQMYLPRSSAPAGAYFFVLKQTVAVAIGALLAFAAMSIDYRRLDDARLIGGLLTILLVALVAVLFRAPVNGARRWLALGFMSVQPSEFAKVALVVALAAFLSRRTHEMDLPTRTLLPVLGIVAVPAGLVLLEPDFGTAFTYFVIAGAMLYFAGLPLKWFFGSALFLVPTLSVWVWSAQYRRDRLIAFLHPEEDPLGKGFHALQSLIAVGTGGVTGLGLGHGKQKLFFLPYPYTDFIYAIVGEELGLIGCVAVLGLFGLVFARGVRAAVSAPDSFGRLLGIGLSVMIVAQAFVNISVVLALVPTKGIPLPFLSYGGSALWADLLAVGILLNLSQHAS
ncbi:MAG: putative lipid II flippase FtsW [Thermoanaerobaculia bacterium]